MIIKYRLVFTEKSLDSDQKDYIISQLKAELYEYHQQQPDFGGLNNQLNILELKYAQVQEELVKLEKEGRQRSEGDLKQISQLRSEIDLLRSELHAQQYQNHQAITDQNQLKDIVAIKQIELDKLKKDIKELWQSLLKFQDQRKELEKEIKQINEDQIQSVQENEQQQREYEEIIQNIRSLDKKIKDAEYDQLKAEKYQQTIKRTQDNLNKEVKQKQEILQQQQQKLAIIEDQVNQLQQLHQQLKDKVQNLGEENQQQNQQLKQEIQQQKELLQDLINTEQQCKQKDIETDDLLNQNEQQNLIKFNYLEDSKFLNVEMSRAIDIIAQLSDIKKELCHEIQAFQKEDKQAISILSRENVQNKAIENAEQKIHASLQNINHFLK
ncbi:hypothetical protein pb186bvf_016550 [Paramecium bursaria]